MSDRASHDLCLCNYIFKRIEVHGEVIAHVCITAYEDFYNFVALLCLSSITSGITVAETLLMIFPLE